MKLTIAFLLATAALVAASTPNHRPRAAFRKAAASDRVAFFLGTETKTASAAVAVDAKGGHHIAFTQFLPQADEPQFFYFTFTNTSPAITIARTARTGRARRSSRAGALRPSKAGCGARRKDESAPNQG